MPQTVELLCFFVTAVLKYWYHVNCHFNGDLQLSYISPLIFFWGFAFILSLLLHGKPECPLPGSVPAPRRSC